jgi:hypothetical protein
MKNPKNYKQKTGGVAQVAFLASGVPKFHPQYYQKEGIFLLVYIKLS